MTSVLWSPIVSDLDPYIPGEQPKEGEWIKLNTNENPYAPSIHALKAIQSAAEPSLRLYPDPESEQLKRSIAHIEGLTPDQVFVGNGSDEVLAHAFFAFFQKDQPVLIPDITYSFYPVYCRLWKIDYRSIPLDDELRIRIDDYAMEASGVVFANPNAPTGRYLPLDDIERLLKRYPQSVIVVDEAYIAFGGQSASCLIENYPNLLIIRTFSKSHALAGLRVGYALGDQLLIEALNRVKNSFNSYPLDRLATAGAIAAIEDQNWLEEVASRIMKLRDDLHQALSDRGFDVIPSRANFLFVRHSRMDAAVITGHLRDKRILVRHFRLPRIENYIRISIGTADDHKALLTALDDILGRR